MLLDRLRDMARNAIALDLETHKFQPGLKAPPIVCAAVARMGPDGNIYATLVNREQLLQGIVGILKDPTITLVNSNIAFDMVAILADFERIHGKDAALEVCSLMFAAYDAGRIFDPILCERLHHIALGCLGADPNTGREMGHGDYNHDTMHYLVSGKRDAKKNDKYRTSYALLEPTPISLWREKFGPEAVDYVLDDARTSLGDALAQAGILPNVGPHDFRDGMCQRCKISISQVTSASCTSVYMRQNIHDVATQTYTAFAMQLGATWGLRVNPVSVAELKFRVTAELEEDLEPYRQLGIVDEDGTEKQAVLKRLVAQAYGAAQPCKSCAGYIFMRGRSKELYREPGKIPSEKTGKPVNCPACDGTGLELPESVPRSEKDGISKKRDVLMESGDETLIGYAQLAEDRKIRTTYIPFMEEGIVFEARLHDDELDPQGLGLQRCKQRIASIQHPTIPICLGPNALIETNRASYRDKSQTLPKEGGVRECFEPDPGFTYYSDDYTGIEMAAWAQICLWLLGRSDLADALAKGLNAHGRLGAQMCGMDYASFMKLVKEGDPRAKTFRSTAKWGNFGFMGGAKAIRIVMQVREQGPDTPHPTGPIMRKGKRVYKGTRFCLLIGGAERCGIKMRRQDWKGDPIPAVCEKCIECSEWLYDSWCKTWSESKPYFARIKAVEAKRGWQIHPTSKRLRGGIGYTDGANGYFQELAACGAKAGLRACAREMYDPHYRAPDLTQRSILFNNARNIVFLHDELFGVARREVDAECADRIAEVMVREMKVHIPDVKVESEPTLMAKWDKAAQCVRDANGRLKIWEKK